MTCPERLTRDDAAHLGQILDRSCPAAALSEPAATAAHVNAFATMMVNLQG
jgi:hypothetical protein